MNEQHDEKASRMELIDSMLNTLGDLQQKFELGRLHLKDFLEAIYPFELKKQEVLFEGVEKKAEQKLKEIQGKVDEGFKTAISIRDDSEMEEIRRTARLRFSYIWAFGLTSLTGIGWILFLGTDNLLLLWISATLFFFGIFGLFYMLWKVMN